jgi:hypothetical protein
MMKHGTDVIDIQALFDGRPIVTIKSVYPDEPRFLTTGEIDGTF